LSAPENPRDRFAWQVRVYYEDTDFSGLVYHANYLRFFERARTEWLRWLGHEQTELKARDNLVFVIRRLEVDYLKAARLDDLIDISVELTPSKHHVYHHIDQEARVRGELIARARVKMACLDADTLKPRVIPDLRPKTIA
jgi:acyl-CoA thioester hydrolase